MAELPTKTPTRKIGPGKIALRAMKVSSLDEGGLILIKYDISGKLRVPVSPNHAILEDHSWATPYFSSPLE